MKVENFTDLSDYNENDADLSKIPILTHYKRDGGAYITAGVVFAKDPETGVQNASIHRMMVLNQDHLAIFSLVLHIPETTGISYPFTFVNITVSLGYFLSTFAASYSALILSSI